MGWFRRRKPGRHALGGAVRDIPSAPLPVLVHPSGPAVRVDDLGGTRVELGFRDGSTAALAPDSAQARALTEIAAVLTRRD
ncbi:MAG TPA: hypothetical protein VM097_08780 [Mycobacteriales bacterium]|nr:hypothetical protein [Mycobacteriales bacterium]